MTPAAALACASWNYFSLFAPSIYLDRMSAKDCAEYWELIASRTAAPRWGCFWRGFVLLLKMDTIAVSRVFIVVVSFICGFQGGRGCRPCYAVCGTLNMKWSPLSVTCSTLKTLHRSSMVICTNFARVLPPCIMYVGFTMSPPSFRGVSFVLPSLISILHGLPLLCNRENVLKIRKYLCYTQ